MPATASLGRGSSQVRQLIRSHIQMEQIQALRFDVQQVGKHVKGSKKRYCWEIALKDKSHTIVLDFSFISGKVKITVDRKILLENELPADVSFQYPFTLDGFALNIIQQGESFELRINNKVFSHLYTQQKTNTEFRKYEDEVKDIKVDVSNFNPQNKKISLNIGAFGAGGMKKKKETGGEGQSWNAFAGGSFPSYFGEEQAQSVEKVKAVPIKNLLDEEEVAERTAKDFNSLQAVKVQKKSEDIFELISGQAPMEASNPQEFVNMQDMFSSLNAIKTSNEVDFFADSSPTKKEEIKPPTKVNVPVFDLNPNPSGLAGFATGFGLEANSQLNPKSFSTSAGGKSFGLGDLDFSIGSAKQEPSFVKKSSQENPTYTQMAQSFCSHLNPRFQSQAPVPIANDFNTMRHMFDTTNFSNSNNFAFTQPEPVPTVPAAQLNFGNSQFQPNKEGQPKVDDFSTMQLLFQTNSASQIQAFSQQPSFSQPEPVPQKPNPLDMFNNSKPASFSTISGGSAFPNNFDMSSFGTMPGKGGLQLNFFESKPAAKPAPSGDLI